MCCACGRLGSLRLCLACQGTLAPAPDRSVAGVVVRSAWLHEGASRRLVHRLKYQGLASAAVPIAERLIEVIRGGGDEPTALVPLPRAGLRRGLYGIDPADVLALALGRALHVPVVRAVRPGVWWPRHARLGQQRAAPSMSAALADVPDGAAFVDDVVTTGSTIATAGRLFPEVAVAYTATAGAGRRGPGVMGTSVSSRTRRAE